MFESARLKLTFFYLAAVIVLSLALTYGTRALAEHAFDNTSAAQEGGIRALLRREVGLPLSSNGLDDIQKTQADQINRELNEYIIYINLVAIVVGGIGSYWFAGRTLKPIKEAHETQARFASDASHELRTPLAVMKTENEVFLRQKSFKESEARDQISSNLEEIQRLEQLATNLLTLTQFEQGDTLELANIKTIPIAKLAVEQIERLYHGASKQIKLDVKDVKIYGHRDSLAQILSLFLDNALKYGPKNGEVKLIGKVEEEYYKFMVEDKGPGINPDDFSQIFERLYRGDQSRTSSVPGHGLGLSLAKEIAKANDAGLSVNNIKGGGARFILTVRLA